MATPATVATLTADEAISDEAISDEAISDEAISEAQARQLIEQFESEASTRSLRGFWRLAAGLLAAALSVYALYWTQYSVATHAYRATFLLVALALSFMLYPVDRKSVV